MKRQVAGAFMLSALLALVGCSPSLTASGPYKPGAAAAPSGMRYHLGKNVVVLDVTLIEFESRSIQPDLTTRTKAGIDSATVRMTLKTVPDKSSFYVLDLQPGGLKDQSLTVAVGANGLLTSVNTVSTDRTGEAITNVAKAAASVAGAFFGFARATPAAATKVFDALPQTSQLRAAEHSIAKSRFLGLPTDLIYAAQSDFPETYYLMDDYLVVYSHAEVARENLVAALTTAGNDPDPAKLTDRQLTQLRTIAADLTRRADELAVSLASAVERLKASEKIGRRTTSRTLSRTFELTELPTSADIADEAALARTLAQKQTMLSLFNETGILLGMDLDGPAPIVPAGAGPGGALPPPNPAPRPATPPVADDKVARLYYRDSVLAKFTIRGRVAAIVGTGAAQRLDEKLVTLEERSELVLNTATAPVEVAYSSKAFSNQSLALTFADNGRLSGVTQGASSPVAGAASALANSVSGARDEFSSSLEKAKSIQATKREIELARIQGEADELLKRKAIVDNRLALRTATAGAELNAEKAAIDAQLALLNQRLALAKAEAGFDDSLQAAKVNADVEVLKAQVEALKQQIEVLRQQKALDDAKK